MRHENIFRDLTVPDGRLGFYTKEFFDWIPETGGCYAWFLPLWIYRTNLGDLVNSVSALFNYGNETEKEVEANFTWESIKMRVRRTFRMRHTQRIDTSWNQALKDSTARYMLQQTLLSASLLMPPLYVGKTTNLKRRYVQHTEGRGDGNLFHSRFADCVRHLGLKISVSDLLFVCIKTPAELTKVLRAAGVTNPEDMIEQILMGFCRPPFSLR